MKLLYLAKPYDKNIVLHHFEDEFIRNPNSPAPEVSFRHNEKNYSEKWMNSLSPMFRDAGILLEYIYPLIKGVVSFSPGVDYSSPILQPFKNTKYMPEALRFHKVIFPDGEYVKRLSSKTAVVVNLYNKALFPAKDSGLTGIFTALYHEKKILDKDYEKFYKNTSKIESEIEKISNALHSGDYSEFFSMQDMGIDIDA